MTAVTVESPVGRLGIATRDGAIVRVWWADAAAPPSNDPLLAEAARQVAAYFGGKLTAFDLPLAPGGGDRDRRVFEAMRGIPYGETRTYGELAKALGLLPVEIGQGCAANPIPVIIPCHRVLATAGLGGYSGRGGIETKIALLKLEGG